MGKKKCFLHAYMNYVKKRGQAEKSLPQKPEEEETRNELNERVEEEEAEEKKGNQNEWQKKRVLWVRNQT